MKDGGTAWEQKISDGNNEDSPSGRTIADVSESPYGALKDIILLSLHIYVYSYLVQYP